MNALALALALALGPADPEDRLPRSLSESFVPQDAAPAPAPATVEHAILAGIHVGAADGVDGTDPGFLVGVEWRIHATSWLSVGMTLDFQSRQNVEDAPGVDFFQVPVIWSLMISPPIDLGPFRPYGLAGGGFTVTHVGGVQAFISTDVNFLGCFGLGVEFRLASGVIIDASARYVWAQDPPNTGTFSADWVQMQVGVLIQVGK